jgi:tetratricopeptide (TPR) repeat protein
MRLPRQVNIVVACLIVAAGAVSSAPVTAQTQQQLSWCNGEGTTEQQITGCTAAIESGRFTGKGLATAFIRRGAGYFDEMEYDRAIQDMGEAIRLDPQNPDAFYNRALAYKNKSQYDRAIQDFDQAIKLDPNSAEAFNSRGEAYDIKGQVERAIQDFDQAIRLNPQYAHAYSNRAIAYQGRGEYDRAIQDFDQAIRINPQDAQAFRNRGFVKQQKGDVAGGEADLAKAKALEATGPRSDGVPANEAAPKSWTMAALVLAHLEATKDYKDLSALYEKIAADRDWARSAQGRAVDAQLKNWRSDAAAAVIVEDNGVRVLRFSIGGRVMTGEGILVPDLEKSQAYRETMADGIAYNIITSRLDPIAMVALAAFRNGSTAPPATAVEFLPASAAAGEFYFIDQTGDGLVVLIDPGTISTANGRRTAHVAFVDAMTLWNDVEFEFDCAGKRFKKLSAVTHPMMVRSEGGEWQNARNSIELQMTNAVCRWPEKVTKSIVSASDFQTLIRRASGIVDQQQREKKR